MFRSIGDDPLGPHREIQNDVQKAVVEIDKAAVFGYEQKNPMSVAKLLELKVKL